MSTWKETTLASVATIIPGFAFKSKEFGDSGVAVIKIKDISPPLIDLSSVERIDISNYTGNRLDKYKLTKGDYVVAMTGATIGKVGRMKEDEVAYINQRVAKFMVKENISKDFVYYVLCTDAFQTFIQNNIDSNSAQENISGASMGQFPVYLPPVSEQHAIAEVLNSIDNKIDLLQRQNKTIEQLTQTLFRKWFIEDVEEDWEITKVKDVCITITKGTTPTTLGRQFQESGIAFIKAESMTDEGTFIQDKFAFIDDETDELLKRSRIQDNDVLITIAGTIGRVGLVTKDIIPANTNQAVAIIRADTQKISPYFLYCLFRTTEIRNDFEGRIVHAVQPNLSLGEIGDIEFRMPPKKKLNDGIKEMEMLFRKKNSNITQINSLTKLKDSLLPKLMSGEIAVLTDP